MLTRQAGMEQQTSDRGCDCRAVVRIGSKTRTSKDEVRCRFGKRLRSRSYPQAALLLLLVLVSPQRALAALFFECLGTLRSCRQKLRAVCAHESFKCNPV